MKVIKFDEIKNGKELADMDTVPLHMKMDYERRNDNINKGFKLCQRCQGTGNQLYSMYQECKQCNGKGVN